MVLEFSTVLFLTYGTYWLHTKTLGKKGMRDIVELDEVRKKYELKLHDSFELSEDQLVLESERNGARVFQNYLLFDEPEGVRFNIGDEYIVEIKVIKLIPEKPYKSKPIADISEK